MFNLQLSPNAFVVKTSRNCTTFECCSFFHISTTVIHFVDCKRKPKKAKTKKKEKIVIDLVLRFIYNFMVKLVT